MENNKTKQIVTVAMMAAVLSILSIMEIPGPTGVPWTLQVFAVALCGYVLGAKAGTLAVLVFILIGTAGIPVFSGMTAGPGVLVGVSGGFLFGFLPQAACCGLFVNRKQEKKGVKIALLAIAGIIGAAICEVCGAVTIALVGGMSYGAALVYCFVSFFPVDIAKTMLALFISLPVRRGLHKAQLLD